MKKTFKALAIAAAATAVCAGISIAATGCSTGKNGTYNGEYHYVNWGNTYGMAVEVKVENNIITKITDVTNTDNAYAKSVQVDKDGNAVEWHTVSAGWEDYFKTAAWLHPEGWKDGDDIPSPADVNFSYSWTNADAANWTTYENWLLQQYVGWSVADILDISVYHNNGEPYATKGGYNAELLQSGLLISSATQGSGRLLLAVQNALGK